ncbi:MAG: oligogalacturonate-specific porin KdgM family protein [Kluyvera sp.]|uniref:oligogalacturonate-specific porin KdgM family protein n=1 Tax=Kluyvera sp. TaxID=1538228 RepID=UPI003A8C09C9
MHIIKTSKFFISFLLLNVSFSAFAGGFLEVREAYESASKDHQLKLGGGYNFNNGAGVLYQTVFNTGKNLEQLKHTFDELEGWYPLWHITDKLTFYPGGIINSTSAGSTTSPYVQLGYIYNSDLGLAFKYRYNHMNYQTNDLRNEMDYNDNHQLVMVVNYKITDKVSYEFEPDFYINTGNYKRKNGKDHSWELNHKFTWKMSPTWRPFVQLSWLDRDNSNNAERYRIRLGIRYYF